MGVEQVTKAVQDESYQKALTDLLFQLADDELFLGHRDSEWLGIAPGIEEDVAFSSVSQDEVGHALFFLERLAELGETDPDTLAFMRQADERRNASLLNSPMEIGPIQLHVTTFMTSLMMYVWLPCQTPVTIHSLGP